MNVWMVTRKISFSLAFVASVAVLLYGCLPLQQALEQNPLGNSDNSVLGINPGSNGMVNFSMRGMTKDSQSDEGELKMEVKNSDGSYSPCTYEAADIIDGSDFNSLALLIDESGSMGNEYPVDLYGDICVTCPHDPQRLRADASRELIEKVHANAPESRIAVMVFGPDPSAGFSATKVLHDFSIETDELIESLHTIDGMEMVGTPLWDSLYENVTETDEAAVEFEDVLLLDGRKEADGSEIEVQRVLLVLSDGDDRDSLQYGLDDVISRAREAGVVIHAIGLGPASADPVLRTLVSDAAVDEQIQTVQNLQRLAQETGGFYASVHDAAALTELYAAIADGLTNGYAQETWECLPDGNVPRPGTVVEGRVVNADGKTVDEWSMVTPED